jgi:hypothetical protein
LLRGHISWLAYLPNVVLHIGPVIFIKDISIEIGDLILEKVDILNRIVVIGSGKVIVPIGKIGTLEMQGESFEAKSDR